MVCQDFERYAIEKQMDGLVADKYKEFFFKWTDFKNQELRVLDFACGDGKYYGFFRKFFKEKNIFGVEISKIRVERCKNKGWRNVILIKRYEKLPFPDRYFDLVNFDQVIEHIPNLEVNLYLEEFSRVLRANGKLIIVTPNYPIKRLYDFFNIFLMRDLKRMKDDPTHIMHYNFSKLKRKLKKYFIFVDLNATGGAFYTLFKNKFWSHKIIGVCMKK